MMREDKLLKNPDTDSITIMDHVVIGRQSRGAASPYHRLDLLAGSKHFIADRPWLANISRACKKNVCDLLDVMW